MSAPGPYNLASPQTISINEAGLGAGGPYMFVGDQSVSPAVVRVYKNNGTGVYTLLQTINPPDSNDLLINPGCYDDGSGFLVLGSQNKLFLYKAVAGLFTQIDTYNPSGGNTLLGGTTAQISGANVVVMGRDFGTGQQVCKYLTVGTGFFVFQQSFNQAADTNRGTFIRGQASFSGTHFVITNRVSFSMTCFELAAGAFSLVQTIAGVLFCNVLNLGFLFVATSGAGPVIDVFTFGVGPWTLTQTIPFPVFPGTITPEAPYSFTSSTLGASILLITASWSGGQNGIAAAYLTGGSWTIYQSGSIGGSGADLQGLVGAQAALFMPDGGDNEALIFLAAGTTGTNIVLGLKGMKVYPQ